MSFSHINCLNSRQLASFISPCLVGGGGGGGGGGGAGGKRGTERWGIDSQLVINGSRGVWDSVEKLIDNRVEKRAEGEGLFEEGEVGGGDGGRGKGWAKPFGTLTKKKKKDKRERTGSFALSLE